MTYRTLIFAHLVQETPLTLGGNQPHLMVDVPLARDGRGRPVIRGSTLAGCFIATARAIQPRLPMAITRGSVRHRGQTAQQDTSASLPSVWRFAHAHVVGSARPTVFCQHVAIESRTLAAKDDHAFSLEATVPGTRWSFELEIFPTTDEPYTKLEALAAATLSVWRQPGGARLGRGGGHGYGWCHLDDIVVVRLEEEQQELWPDAFAPDRSPQEWGDYFRQHNVQVLTLDALLKEHAAVLPRSERHFAELSGSIDIGERTDDFGAGYGLDTLSVGGHARLQLDAEALYERVLWPQEGRPSRHEFKPDFVINTLPDAQGRLRPYVPGASLRGVLRSAMQRHWRAQNKPMSVLEQLFGNTERAGCLRVSDAALISDDWRLMWHQHVAIDGLSGGAFESAKFDRLSLAYATLRWCVRIESENEHQARTLAGHLSEVIEQLGEGHLPLGGGVWRGHGHVRWRLDDCQIRPLFGES